MPPCTKPGGAGRRVSALYGRGAHLHCMTIITDPLFYLLAVPAIAALGLGKGGFAGVGMISTPLLALTVPPLQAAAILLPILLCQDAISVWVYRREWSAWNLKVLLPGRGGRRRRGLAVRRLCAERLCGDRGRRDRRLLRALHWFAQRAGAAAAAERGGRRVLGLARGLHLDHHPGRRSAVPGAHPAAAARQVHAHRHHHHLLRAGERDEARALFRARPVLDPYAWRPPPCSCRSRSPPIFSASGLRAARRPSCSTRSPTC